MHNVKEYVQASTFDQHLVQAIGREQLFTINFPKEIILRWKAEGFTHIHFGAIRIALTFHGRKGLPMVSRIAIIDTRCDKYQQVCLVTIQSTFNAKTIFVTIFPNFNMSLNDLTLPTAPKYKSKSLDVP